MPTQELHATALEIIDSPLDLQLAILQLLADELALPVEELDGVEDIQLHCMAGDVLLRGIRSQLFSGLRDHHAESIQQLVQSLVDLRLHSRSATRLEEHLRCATDGAAAGMAQHEDQLCAYRSNREFQGSHDAPLGMSARVPCIAQNEDIPRHGIENGLQRRQRICRAQNRRVGSLPLSHQGLAHLGTQLSRDGRTDGEALVALAEQPQRLIRFGGAIQGGADRERQHRGRQGDVGSQELCLLRRRTHELHSTGFEMVDATMDLQLPCNHPISERPAEPQKEVDRVEDVHFDRMVHEDLHAAWGPKVSSTCCSAPRQTAPAKAPPERFWADSQSAASPSGSDGYEPLQLRHRIACAPKPVSTSCRALRRKTQG
eukprot:CAMPEP_0181450874 /NCGR_PEP_ID=MMETSP1110-20121109/28398_1 /TAXON_ID=174948 /ORGANISM="Symbiodinium sp., Strain CCMP421" /LENGTH=372 /DNA_ID=CAMNT_0023575103 /DNA_START=38 /DNA_END=1154 /DNA_ORIENTATION=-